MQVQNPTIYVLAQLFSSLFHHNRRYVHSGNRTGGNNRENFFEQVAAAKADFENPIIVKGMQMHKCALVQSPVVPVPQPADEMFAHQTRGTNKLVR